MIRSIAMALCAGLMLLCALGANAQTVPGNGLWVDQSNPQRYCVVERAQFAAYGDQVFLHCAMGAGSAGSNVVLPYTVASGVYLYRLQDSGGYLVPTLLYAVRTISLTPTTWRVNFGDTPQPYTLTRAASQQIVKPADR